ncbi:MAG: lysophospholipid acyltransferase family protein [Victivallaceae bacterium]|nr:lysophospholipid acyltransferase family protein [Victivallaceae bacterium]
MALSGKAAQKSKTILYLEFIPFVVLYNLIRLMPLKVAYYVCRSLFILLYHIDQKHLKRSMEHLMHAGVAKTPEEAREIAYCMYKHGGRLIVELAKIEQHYSKVNLTFSGNERAWKQLLGSGKRNIPAIIVTAHYGNWEVSGKFWTELAGTKLLTVVRAFDNPLIGNYVMKMRTNDKHKVIPKTDSLKYMLKALRSNYSIALLMDQHASSREGVETVFFGQPARTHASAALLHLKTGVPIAPMILRCKEKLFHYDAIFDELIEYKPTEDKEKDIQVVTQMYTSALERLIAQDPKQWLWAHRRWLNINRKHGRQESQKADDQERAASLQTG